MQTKGLRVAVVLHNSSHVLHSARALYFLCPCELLMRFVLVLPSGVGSRSPTVAQVWQRLPGLGKGGAIPVDHGAGGCYEKLWVDQYFGAVEWDVDDCLALPNFGWGVQKNRFWGSWCSLAGLAPKSQARVGSFERAMSIHLQVKDMVGLSVSSLP